MALLQIGRVDPLLVGDVPEGVVLGGLEDGGLPGLAVADGDVGQVRVGVDV